MGPTKAEGEKGHRQYEIRHLGACGRGGTELGELEHGAAIIAIIDQPSHFATFPKGIPIHSVGCNPPFPPRYYAGKTFSFAMSKFLEKGNTKPLIYLAFLSFSRAWLCECNFK